MDKETKIDAAIRDTKLRLNKANEDIMLLTRERNVLLEQINTLELIKANPNLE